MRSFLFILFLLNGLWAKAQCWQWGISSNGHITKVAEDAVGNVYIAGFYTGTMSLGNFNFENEGTCSFVAMIDIYGNCQWAKEIRMFVSDLDVVNAKIFVTGNFSDSLSFNDVMYIPSGADGLIVALDLSGNFLWLKQGSGAGNNSFNSLSVNSTGKLCIAGTTIGQMFVDGNHFNSGAFVVLLNQTGDFTDNVIIGDHCIGREIDSDSMNNIYVLCNFDDTINIDGTQYFPDYSGSHFIVKYDSNGSLLWLNVLGGNYYYPNTNLTVTRNGDFYVSKNQRYSSIVLSKFSASGNLIWSGNYGGSVYDRCYDLGLDNQENLYMTGSFWYNASFGGIAVTGNQDCLFLAKLDSSGNAIWVKAETSNSEGSVHGVAVSFVNSDHGYLIGEAWPGANLDSHPVSGSFVARLSWNLFTSIKPLIEKDPEMILFPNPSSGYISIDMNNFNPVVSSISIYDNSGKNIYWKSIQTSENKIVLDLSEFSQGYYTIELIADNKKWFKKVIVQ
jgi:hypothetical protein